MIFFDRQKILKEMREHPSSVRRLLVVKGWERRFADLIIEARRLGISVRFIGEEEGARKSRGKDAKAFLETSSFCYTDEEDLLRRIERTDAPALAVFDGIYDPQNLGNILRTAACLGIDGIVIPKDRSCGVTEAAIRVSRGGSEFVTVARVTNIRRFLERLKAIGLAVVGLDERGDKSIFELDLSSPFVFVFGREDGLRRLTRETCDLIVKIPTSRGFPSLNLASTFAIALYEAKRQRLRGA